MRFFAHNRSATAWQPRSQPLTDRPLNQSIAFAQLGAEGLHLPLQTAANDLVLLRRIHSSLGRAQALLQRGDLRLGCLAGGLQISDLLLLSPVVAQGALAKVGEDPTDHVTHLTGQAWNLLRSGAQGNPKAETALEIYQEEPDDQRNLDRLARYLADYLRQHHQAGDDLRTVVTHLQQQAQPAGISVTFTNHGTNDGQQTGVNYGTMTQTTQTITNTAPNQGAQGTFHGPVRRVCRKGGSPAEPPPGFFLVQKSHSGTQHQASTGSCAQATASSSIIACAFYRRRRWEAKMASRCASFSVSRSTCPIRVMICSTSARVVICRVQKRRKIAGRSTTSIPLAWQ